MTSSNALQTWINRDLSKQKDAGKVSAMLEIYSQLRPCIYERYDVVRICHISILKIIMIFLFILLKILILHDISIKLIQSSIDEFRIDSVSNIFLFPFVFLAFGFDFSSLGVFSQLFKN